MVNIAEIEEQLISILNEAAKKLNLKKFSHQLNLNAQKGDGFLGEFYKVSILDEETNKKIALALKKAPTEKRQREEYFIDLAYKNEIYFYSVVFPTLKKFEEEHQVSIPFDSIPGYVTSIDDINKEMIVLNDVTVDGFEMWDKNLLFDEEHVKFIFATYGRFHALSFCFKDQKFNEYQNLTKPFIHRLKILTKSSSFCDFLNGVMKLAGEILDKDSVILEKFKKYMDNTTEILSESLEYHGEYSGIIHGDCWSNNMMFKYQRSPDHSKLESMKLLDFQLVSVGTPVYDLAYFLYSGCSKELFDKLEDYLDIYHENFSKVSRELGSNPDKLLPREILTQDWKKFCKFGMLMGILSAKLKLISKEDSIQMLESADMEPNSLLEINYDKQLFDKRVRDILFHMYEIDAL